MAKAANFANLATAGCMVFSPSICPSCLGPSGLVANALLIYELVYIAIAIFAGFVTYPLRLADKLAQLCPVPDPTMVKAWHQTL